MDTDLKCNRLTCRKSLTDKAVVTTCSHIFCVECANELFTAARLCPACETALTEPDDVVVCSLRPSNDYKTSVLSGLSPSIILEICSRAISFWQYQIHQENSFQQAVVRNLTDKNAQLQKQLDNVVREANGEINLLNDKTNELQRELELERRKTRDLQEAQRERDKEYQKLKAHFDKLKRKALLPSATPDPMAAAAANAGREEYQHARQRNFGGNPGNSVNIEEVVGGMEASGIQRTPLVARTANAFAGRTQSAWINQQQQVPQQAQQRHKPHRQSFVAQHESGNINGSHPNNGNVSYSGNVSDRSESMHDADSVREMLMPGQQQQPRHSMTAQQGLSTNQAGSWGRAMSSATRPRMQSNAFPASASRSAGVFRPSRVPR